jgi:hypothetical protein
MLHQLFNIVNASSYLAFAFFDCLRNYYANLGLFPNRNFQPKDENYKRSTNG